MLWPLESNSVEAGYKVLFFVNSEEACFGEGNSKAYFWLLAGIKCMSPELAPKFYCSGIIRNLLIRHFVFYSLCKLVNSRENIQKLEQKLSQVSVKTHGIHK